MKILSIEIMSTAAGMLLIDGDKDAFEVSNLRKGIVLAKDATTIKSILEFQAKFGLYIKSQQIDRLVLVEGGKDSKKMRVQMEFAILSECEKLGLEYITYPAGTCTRLINSGYKKDTGRAFSDDLKKMELPKYMSKALVAGWRFLSS